MSVMNKKWRCPYCDGLNDWQNEVCEICGDGRRADVEAAGKAAEVSRTCTPSRENAPAREAAPAFKASQPLFRETRPVSESPAPKPKKSKAGLALALVFIVAALGTGAYFLFGEQLGLRSGGWQSVVVLTDEDRAAAQTLTFLSVEDTGYGVARIRLDDRAPKSNYELFTLYVGQTPDRSSRPYNTDSGDRLTIPWVYTRFSALDRAVERPVIPNAYTRFVVHAFNDGERGVWVQSEPYWFSGSDAQLPFTITNVSLCGWENDVARMNWQTAAQTEGVKPPSKYSITRTDQMNTNLRLGRAFGYALNIEMNTDASGLAVWEAQRQLYDPARMTVLLTGPNDLSATAHGYLNCEYDGYHDQYVDFDAFTDNYAAMKAQGGYPAGDYQLDFYVWGVKAYTWRFTLKDLN